MKFGVVTHAVGHHMPFEKTLQTIKEIGFDSVLLLTGGDSETVSAEGRCKDAFPNVLGSDPEHVRKAMENAGLEIGALHFSGKIDVASDAGIDPTVSALKEYAACALALGCRNLTHPVPSCGRTRMPTEEKENKIRRLAMCVNSVAEAFEPMQLRIAGDIHFRAWVEGLDDCRLYLDAMPCKNAGIILNIGHLTTAESYGWLLVDEYPDRIPVVGWKDHSLARDRPRPMWSIELGTGHSPFGLYAQAFKRNPEDRVHLVNCEHVPDGDRMVVLKRSRDYLLGLWYGIAEGA